MWSDTETPCDLSLSQIFKTMLSMSERQQQTIHERLLEIQESIALIFEWSQGMEELHDFMVSPNRVMAFNACVMRLQVIGEHVGKLLKDDSKPLDDFPAIPWVAIYDMRNLISHEYGNIDEGIVLSVIKDDLPKLQETISALLEKY